LNIVKYLHEKSGDILLIDNLLIHVVSINDHLDIIKYFTENDEIFCKVTMDSHLDILKYPGENKNNINVIHAKILCKAVRFELVKYLVEDEMFQSMVLNDNLIWISSVKLDIDIIKYFCNKSVNISAFINE
jgi:hypothetical protein